MGDGGFQSLSLGNLFAMASKTWSFGGDIQLPIFQGGKLVGNLKAKRAKTEAVAHTYQQTILKALQETETAIISQKEDLESLKQRKESTTHYEDLVFLSKERFTKGVVNLLNLLETQRQYITSEQELLGSNAKALIDTVRLYKALGGGWEN